MEDLIDQLSGGSSSILFLVGLSEETPSSSQHLLFHISQIQKKCRQLYVVLFVKNHGEDIGCGGGSSSAEVDTSSLNSSQVIVIDCNQSSKSLQLQHWLEICKYTFLIDMYFGVDNATGQLSVTTSTILEHLSKSHADTKIVCLHSETMLHNNKVERSGGKRKKKLNVQPRDASSKQQGLKILTSAFEGLMMNHMVGDPQQVLGLMSWSVDTLHHLSYDIMRMNPPEPIKCEHSTSESAVTIAPAGTYTQHCVSEVFLPLLQQLLTGGVPPSPENLHSMSSIADSMLEMSSPERSQQCMKRLRDDEYGQQLSFHSYSESTMDLGGTALKRSHTLSTIRGASSVASQGDQPRSGSSGIDHQSIPRHGRSLKRSISEGRAVRTHPPRPPPVMPVGSRVQGGAGEEHGRSYMADEGYSNESGGSFEWPSWRSEQDNESIISASQLSVGSPSQHGLPDSQRSGHGIFRHIFSQEDKTGTSAACSTVPDTSTGSTLLSIPSQSLLASHGMVLPPGSPGAPLFMLNESSNHSQLSLSQSQVGGYEGDCQYQHIDTNSNFKSTDNNSNPSHGQTSSRTQSQSASSGKRELDRKLSFLSSSQVDEIEESGVNASGTFKFSSGL